MHVYFVENENLDRDSSGGVMTYLMNLIRYLNQTGIQPTILGVGKPSEKSRLRVRLLAVAKGDVPNWRYLGLLFFRCLSVPDSRETVIHAQRADYLVPFLVFFRKAAKICTLHGRRDIGVEFKKGRLLGKLYLAVMRFCFRHGDLFIAVDRQSLEEYIRRFPFLKEKIIMIPVGIDLERFYPRDKMILRSQYGLSPQDKIVVFAGRLEAEKNLYFLIDSCFKAHQTDRRIRFLLVGKGSLERRLREYASRLGFSNVVFLGEVSYDRMPEVLNLSDVLVLASVYEGSPNVVKEALACNVPVVSTDVGDVKSVLKGLEGCHICSLDSDEFSHRILETTGSDRPHNYRDNLRIYASDTIGGSTWNAYEEVRRRKRDEGGQPRRIS